MSEITPTEQKGGIGEVVHKLLGPTAEYLGDELKTFTQKRIENRDKIFSNAVKKADDKLDRPGQVPPKVLKTIVNEGSYADDTVAVEYFGGVLASSRTEVGRDDRGSRLAKMIDNLSAYQLRSHYLIYSTISELFSNSGNTFNLGANRTRMRFFMPFQDYFQAMAFTQQELDSRQLLPHIFHGLTADELIANALFGSQEFLNNTISDIPSDGVICTPSGSGAELLLWAFGHGDKELDFLLTEDFSPQIEGIPISVPNAVATIDIANKSS